jgi:hypothetical protein
MATNQNLDEPSFRGKVNSTNSIHCVNLSFLINTLSPSVIRMRDATSSKPKIRGNLVLSSVRSLPLLNDLHKGKERQLRGRSTHICLFIHRSRIQGSFQSLLTLSRRDPINCCRLDTWSERSSTNIVCAHNRSPGSPSSLTT